MPLSALGQEASNQAPRTATKAEYLACLVEREVVDRKTQALQERDKLLKARAVKFQAAEADLADQVKRNPPRTKKEIDSYNRAVSARNKSAESFNEQGQSLQREQQALNAMVIETNAKCGGLLVSADIAAAAEQEFQNLPRPK